MSIDSHVLESLGWALIHSTWQAAVVFIMYAVASRMLGKDANNQYVLALFALIAIPIAFVITLLLLLEQSPETIVAITGQFTVSARDVLGTAASGLLESTRPFLSWIDVHLAWVIRIWFIGSIIGLLRVMSGMMYLRSLRLNALPVAREWEEKINGLAIGLQIKRKVSIAEGCVSTPMVIGYIKPIVLFPIGLMSGLTGEQVEAVLLHELAHIRRHDFVVNLFQCMMESIFFFNPVVWILSSRIRTLREHCCDDLVIKRGVNPLAYVKTLAFVEEASAGGTLALALIGERNQMLNRMKRIMERSVVKKEWGSMRLLPLGLILVGLICASWLSIGTEQHDQSLSTAIAPTVTSDSTVVRTPGKETQNSFYYKREFNGDATTQPKVAGEDVNAHFWAFPGPTPQMFKTDSVPAFYYGSGEWEKFEKEFTEKFSKEFGEFFAKNQEQFAKMMEELRSQHEATDVWALQGMRAMSSDQMGAMAEQFRYLNPQIPNLENLAVPEPLGFLSPDALMSFEDAGRMAEIEKTMSEMMLHGEHDLLRAQEELMQLDETLLRINEDALHEYENAMVNQLVEDGYLKKGEKLNDLKIHDDEITVNGKKVKEKDLKKYKDISDKYEPRWSPPRRPE